MRLPRTRTALAGIASLCLLAQCGSSSQAAAERLYLLGNAAGQEWCIYRDETEWKADVQRQHAAVVATVEQASGRFTAISVTEQDETGDWIVYDHYTVGADAELQSLKRTINILPGARSEERVFRILGGRAIAQSSATRELGTGKPIKATETWLPDVPVRTRIRDFPFASLIGRERLKSSAKKLCASVRR